MMDLSYKVLYGIAVYQKVHSVSIFHQRETRVVKTMSGLFCRRQQLRIVIRPWIWLLLTVLFAWHTAEATDPRPLFQSSEYLSSPAVTPEPFAATLKTQQAKDPIPVPVLHPLAPPSGASLLRPADTSPEPVEIAPILLPPLSTKLTQSFPRPPPTV
ncbi:MAG: hypothetical protein R2940_00960 [Syntrophotaleaceae bacterium]